MERPRYLRLRTFEQLTKILRHFDIQISRYSKSTRFQRNLMLQDNQISVVLDVGANVGQYAKELRSHGFAGRIVSFEPLRTAFRLLQRQAESDSLWECRQIALGDVDGWMKLNIASNSKSSSLLPMRDRHVEAAPESRYVGIEEVEIRRLDSIREEVVGEDDRLWLKIDVQGYEEQVLVGADKILEQVSAIELELSLVPLYENQDIIWEMASTLRCRGYELAWIERGYLRDPQTGHTLQVDGIFIKVDS